MKTNEEKYYLFLEEHKYVRFIWNGVEKTVWLPKEKLAKRMNQIQDFLELGAELLYTNVKVMTGRLNHVLLMLSQIRCNLCSLYWMLKNWMYKEKCRTLLDNVEEDVHYWLMTLNKFTPTQLIASPKPMELGWVGNASTGYGIGVLIGGRWAQFRLKSLKRLGDGSAETWRESVS